MQKIGLPNSIHSITPISVGTVQLGHSYGVANQDGMPDHGEAMAVLDTAWANGARTIDTARAYGEAEARIGQWMKERGHHPFIVTKVGSAIRGDMVQSMSALDIRFLDGLMLHNARDLSVPGVVDILSQFVQDGLIGGFGVSAYQVEDVDAALAIPGLSMVQVPFNLFDRRMETSGVLACCMAAGVTVFSRSVFLQGLFFLDPETLPGHLAEAAGPLRSLRAFADEIGRSLPELAIVAARDTPGVSSLVIGAERANQAREVFELATAAPLTDREREATFMIGVGLPEIIYNPGLWP
jgi:aryl-alcohol dehydrogenase-like predicted oxidoreductase